MGLYASGKSTIKSVVFEGKDPKDFIDKAYSATINYQRDIKSMIGTEFQIFDLGGQENYLNDFVGEKAEFIFNNVLALVWVVDVNAVENVSISKFYFDKAVENLVKYSPDAIIFCLLHKIDLVLGHMVDDILGMLKDYFQAPDTLQIHHIATSIFNKSIFTVFGEITKILISQSGTAKSVGTAITSFVEQSQELSGITVYTEEGLPVFEEGELLDKIVVPANLWLSASERIREEFQTSKMLRTMVETDDYIFVFQKLKEKLLLTGLAKKIAPTQFVLLKMDQLSKTINDLL